MSAPRWLSSHSLYPRARAAALSLRGADRFYNPLSAWLHTAEQERQAPALSCLDEIRKIRLEDGLTIWCTPFGELATMDTEIGEHIAFLVAEFVRHIYLLGPARVNPGTIVLDVGANIGLFTKQALKSGAQQVVALEPTPGTFRALRWNLQAAIAAKQVSAVSTGAWNTAATLRLTVDPARPSRSSVMDLTARTPTYEESIQVDQLDEIVQQLKLPRVDFIKMDIEGAELKALEGAVGILRRYKPQLAIAVEHTDDRLLNAKMVRDLVLGINSEYRCKAGPYVVTEGYRLAPDIRYFN